MLSGNGLFPPRGTGQSCSPCLSRSENTPPERSQLGDTDTSHAGSVKPPGSGGTAPTPPPKHLSTQLLLNEPWDTGTPPALAARTRSPLYQGLSHVLAKVQPCCSDCRRCLATSRAKLQPLQLHKNNSPNTRAAGSRDQRSAAEQSLPDPAPSAAGGSPRAGSGPRQPLGEGVLAGDRNTLGPLALLPICSSSAGPSIPLSQASINRRGSLGTAGSLSLTPEPFQDNPKLSKLPTCPHFAKSPFFLLPSDTRWQLPVRLDFRRELNVS